MNMLPERIVGKVFLVLALVLSGSVTTRALAQATSAAPGPALEEVLVTARKRAESLQKVPITVQAFTAAQLDAAGVNSLATLQSVAPGLTYNELFDREYGQIFIRGMSSAGTGGDTTRELASMYLDGVNYVGAITGLNMDNMERVEVVKGPQSAFFGRSTFAGAVNFVSKTPGDVFAAQIKAKAASQNEYDLSASVEGPLLPGKLSGQIFIRQRDYGGSYTNVLDGQKLGQENDKVVSGILYATPSDAFSAKLRTLYTETDDGPGASQLLGRRAQHNCGPFFGTGPDQTLFCGVLQPDESTLGKNSSTVGPALAAYGNHFGLTRKFFFNSLSMKFAFANGYELESLSGYTTEDSTTLQDIDLSIPDNWGARRRRSENALSQELRFSSPQADRLHWLLGVNYFDQKHLNAADFFGGAANPFGAGGLFGSNTVRRKVSDVAVFASVNFAITPKWSVAAEGRHQRDEVISQLDSGGELAAATTQFLPRFIVDYKPSDNVTIYANAAKGSRATEVNANIAALSPANQATIARVFNMTTSAPEETIWNYELGIKTVGLDGRATLNLAAFHADWRDKQVAVTAIYDLNGNGQIDFVVPATDREFNFGTVSAGRLKVEGFDLDANLRPTEALTLGASLAYSHTTIKFQRDTNYTRFTGKPDAAGQEPPFVPKWSGSVNATLRMPLSNGRHWFTRWDASYIGNKFGDFINTARTGSSFKVNAKLGLEAERFTVTLFADNLFDDRTIDSIYIDGDSATDPIGFAPVAWESRLAKKRQIGAIVSYRF